jgi:hypothetical protein
MFNKMDLGRLEREKERAKCLSGKVEIKVVEITWDHMHPQTLTTQAIILG